MHSGGLQFIKYDHIADNIANYEQEMRRITTAEAPYAKSINDTMDEMSTILVSSVRKDTSSKTNAYPFLTTDPTKIAIFNNKISFERGWTQNYVDNIAERVPLITRLIALL